MMRKQRRAKPWHNFVTFWFDVDRPAVLIQDFLGNMLRQPALHLWQAAARSKHNNQRESVENWAWNLPSVFVLENLLFIWGYIYMLYPRENCMAQTKQAWPLKQFISTWHQCFVQQSEETWQGPR